MSQRKCCYTRRHKSGIVCHSGLDPESSVVLDVLARFGSLRLPSVAPLEFIPMKIGAGMTGIGVTNDAVYRNRKGKNFFHAPEDLKEYSKEVLWE